MRLPLLVACAVVISAMAQPPNDPNPRFEDYPAVGIYNGSLAAPKIVTPVQRKYRTRIREGVEKGWGVYQDGNAREHPGANYSGNLIVVQWGCGAPCLMMAVVDAGTGDVYLPPLAVEKTFALPMLCVGNSVSSNPRITFRRNSRLMVIEATPDCSRLKHHSYAHYFVWERDHWTLLHRERLD